MLFSSRWDSTELPMLTFSSGAIAAMKGCFALLGLACIALLGCPLEAPSSAEGGRATFEVRARHTDLVKVEVFLPPRLEEGRQPALVLLQGGAVPVEDYAWLAERLAARGIVVAMPSHPLNMAIFAVGNAEAARGLLVHPPEGSVLDGRVDPSRIAVGGHSLGGVVATKGAVDEDFSALVLLASYPDGADEKAVRAYRRPVLSIAAEQDCQAELTDVREGAALFGGPRVLAVVERAGHFQFTRDGEEDARRGCPTGLPLEDAHARIESVLFRFLEATWTPGADVSSAVMGVEGVRVEVP